MIKLEYTFKTDTLFKMLFVKYPDLLKQLVSVLLSIRLESIEQFEIINPEMPPENLGDKFCRLDITMTVDGQRVDLEIQVENKGAYPERVLFNWARDYCSALPEGKHYNNLPRTIVISIIDFNLFECAEFHSEYQPLEVSRHTVLSDKMSLHFFELKKIPVMIDANDMLLLWLSLFKAETEEELQSIKALEVPIMNQAINAYQHIKTTAEFREIERLRTKARHDEAQALYYAEKEGEERANTRWQGVVADKDAEIARLREQLKKQP
jgi:predicted transposase/invertase (TIGR01784 family)